MKMKIKEILKKLLMKKCKNCPNKCAWYIESTQGVINRRMLR